MKERTMKKVLVVDDNRLLAATIQEVLEDDGLEVRSAKDGVDGYSAYLLFKPDIVITDIQMPRENGLEMMEHIRAHNPMIKTIYMSGDIDSYRPFLKEEKRKYQVSFFEKPFSMESLKRVVLEPATILLPGYEAQQSMKGLSYDYRSDDICKAYTGTEHGV
jgi:CheY-like chemotaxis protein